MSQRSQVATNAGRFAVDLLEKAHGREAAVKGAARVAMAVDAVRNAIRNPGYFDRCAQDTPSLRQAVSLCIETGLYPGGPNPTCYLVPQDNRLNWRISARGLTTLASEAGWWVNPVPVHQDDKLTIRAGEVAEHEWTADPMTLDELAGVIVVVRRIDTAATIGALWVSHARIMARAATSDSRKKNRGPWRDWGVEMAQKTAVIYCAARGSIPMASPAWSAAVAAEYASGNLRSAQEGPRIIRPAAASPAETLALPEPSFMDEPPPMPTAERETAQADGGAA